jgi:hypothetical protein
MTMRVGAGTVWDFAGRRWPPATVTDGHAA